MQDEEKKPIETQLSKTRSKKLKKITEKRLNNVALNYIARYSATAERLRTVLMRRVEVSARNFGTDRELGAEWIESLISKYKRLGYLNDQNFAEIRIRSMLSKGKSTHAVIFNLRRMGVSEGDIKLALESLSDEFSDLDYYGAIALARRKRLGPYRRLAVQKERRNNDLAILARAGFNYEVATSIVDSKSQEELERIFESASLSER